MFSLKGLGLESKRFAEKEQIKPWLLEILLQNKNINIVIERSDKNKIIFKCKSPNGNRRESEDGRRVKMGSRRLNTCPFKLRANYSIRNKEWTILVVNDQHDHSLDSSYEETNLDSKSSKVALSRKKKLISLKNSSMSSNQEDERSSRQTFTPNIQLDDSAFSNAIDNSMSNNTPSYKNSSSADVFSTFIPPSNMSASEIMKNDTDELSKATGLSNTTVTDQQSKEQNREHGKRLNGNNFESFHSKPKISKAKQNYRSRSSTVLSLPERVALQLENEVNQLIGSRVFNNTKLTTIDKTKIITQLVDHLLNHNKDQGDYTLQNESQMGKPYTEDPQEGSYLGEQNVSNDLIDVNNLGSEDIATSMDTRDISEHQNIPLHSNPPITNPQSEIRKQNHTHQAIGQQVQHSKENHSEGNQDQGKNKQQPFDRNEHDQNQAHDHQQDQQNQQSQKSALTNWLTNTSYSTQNNLAANANANLIPLSPLLNDKDTDYNPASSNPVTSQHAENSMDTFGPLPGLSMNTGTSSFGNNNSNSTFNTTTSTGLIGNASNNSYNSMNFMIPSQNIQMLQINHQTQQLPSFNSIQNQLPLSPNSLSNNSTPSLFSTSMGSSALIPPSNTNFNTTLNPSHLLKSSNSKNHTLPMSNNQPLSGAMVNLNEFKLTSNPSNHVSNLN